MATKKSVSKKTAGVAPAVKSAAGQPAAKTAAKKIAVKTTAAKKTVDVSASVPKTAAKAAPKHQPSHHDIAVQAYLLWERDGKNHGHQDHYWKQAERELHEQ